LCRERLVVILYHYCSNSTFLSIISGQNIRASEFSLSNDHLEGKWSRNLLEQFCIERKMYPVTQSLLLERFDNYLLQYFSAVGFCLSEHGDLLSQWRGYADDGHGVSIGFESSFFSDLIATVPDRSKGFDFLFEKVKYDPWEQQEVARPYFEAICKLADSGALMKPTLLSEETEEENEEKLRQLSRELVSFIPHLYTLKNPAFREENEWRLISLVTPGNPLTLVLTGQKPTGWQLSSLEYLAKPDRLVPFRSIGINPESGRSHPIREIILGPKNITPNAFVDGALRRYGMVARVRRSTSSYR
jgi:hypothetical protein